MKLADLPGFEHVDADAVMATLVVQINRRVRYRTHTPQWSVWLCPEGVTVIPRAELVSRLRVADLPAEAHAAATTKVPPGSILAWIETESGDHTGLVVWQVPR